MINDTDADEELNSALSQAKTPHGTVDNVLRVHSLRPSTMIGHMTLYKSVLHDNKNIHKQIPQCVEIMRYHSLIVDPISMPKCFEISAYCTENELTNLTFKKISQTKQTIFSNNGLQCVFAT